MTVFLNKYLVMIILLSQVTEKLFFRDTVTKIRFIVGPQACKIGLDYQTRCGPYWSVLPRNCSSAIRSCSTQPILGILYMHEMYLQSIALASGWPAWVLPECHTYMYTAILLLRDLDRLGFTELPERNTWLFHL
jgi:hypothetical protein